LADHVVIATDEININGTNAQVQYMKLIDGTADSAALISGDGVYGLDVDVTRINGTVDVNIVGGSSSGVQYKEADTAAAITGTVMFGESVGNSLLPIQLDASSNLKITGTVLANQNGTWNIGSVTTLPNITLASQANPFTSDLSVTGYMVLRDVLGDAITSTLISAKQSLDVNVANSSIIVNAGTNLNTSALALETTASAIKTAVEIIDNAIAGNEMQVDIVSAPTITVQATDLDVRNLSQAQDSVLIYGSDDGGTTKRVIKTDSGGAIQVDLEVASVTVSSGAITETNSASIKTAVELIDDAIYTDGTGTPSKAIGIAGTDGTNPQIIKTDASGELQVDVLTLPNVTIGSAIPAGTNNIGDVDVASITAGDNVIGRVKLTDGTTVASVRDLASNDALNVAIVDGSGNQVTSFGGGTQYTEGDTDASITGTAMLMEVAANALQPVQGTVADGLLVNLGSNNDVVVSATNLDIRDLTSVSDSVSAVQSGTWNINNVAGTVSLPTGAATSSNQSTIIGHLDGVETTLGTIDADTGNISTKIDTIAGAVSGTEMQVDVLTLPNVTIGAAIPAGTNNIGDVDVASIATGDNTIGRVKITDGTDVADILDLTNSNPLTVAIVDGAGTQITSFGGGTQYTEGDTDASITGTAMLMEVAADTLQPVQGTVADGLLVNLGSNNDVVVSATNLDIRDLSSGTDSVAAVQSGTWNVNNISGTVSLPTGAATSANQSTIIGHLDGVEGILTTIDADTGNISTKIDTIAGAVSGTEVQVDVLTLPNVTIGAAIPAGTNNIGDVDIASIAAGTNNIGVVTPHALKTNIVNGVDSSTGTSDVEVIAAQGVGVKMYITTISIANSSSTVSTVVEIKDDTTVIWRTMAPKEGGSNLVFDPPLAVSANKPLNMAALSAATTVYFSANGFKE